MRKLLHPCPMFIGVAHTALNPWHTLLLYIHWTPSQARQHSQEQWHQKLSVCSWVPGWDVGHTLLLLSCAKSSLSFISANAGHRSVVTTCCWILHFTKKKNCASERSSNLFTATQATQMSLISNPILSCSQCPERLSNLQRGTRSHPINKASCSLAGCLLVPFGLLTELGAFPMWSWVNSLTKSILHDFQLSKEDAVCCKSKHMSSALYIKTISAPSCVETTQKESPQQKQSVLWIHRGEQEGNTQA